MKSLKRNLVDISVLGAILLTFALAWGSPFVSSGSTSAVVQEQAQQQPNQDQNKTGTFTGTIVKDGSEYALRDSSGAIFKLDDAERAKPFEGKTVKVTGQLDEQAKVIHVENIEGVEG